MKGQLVSSGLQKVKNHFQLVVHYSCPSLAQTTGKQQHLQENYHRVKPTLSTNFQAANNPHKFIQFPHHQSFVITLLAFRMLCQTQEPNDTLALKIDPFRKILCFEYLVEEGRLVISQMPNLFYQHRLIKFYQVFKAYPALNVWLTQSLPVILVNFPLLSFLPPQKLNNHHLNFMAKANWEFQTSHSKSWYSLYYRFQQNFFACLGQQLLFSTLKFVPDPFFDIVQGCLIISPYHSWETKLFFIFSYFRDPQEIYNLQFPLFQYSFAKEHYSLTSIDLLPRCVFIQCQYS